MGLISNAFSFGLGVVATCAFVPPISEAVSKVKEDTLVILQSKEAIHRMCIDQIARWYYDGTLEEALGNIVREAEINKIKDMQIQTKFSLPSQKDSSKNIELQADSITVA